LAKSNESITSLIAIPIATNDKIMRELFSEYSYEMCVELLFAPNLEKNSLKSPNLASAFH
jgi:hypothetical protein